MHRNLQRLGANQGSLATTNFDFAWSSRRHGKRFCSRQLTVSANDAQGQVQKRHKQRTAPKQGLPADRRKPGLPATPVQPKTAHPDVSASDRTLNVIVQVCKLSNARANCGQSLL